MIVIFEKSVYSVELFKNKNQKSGGTLALFEKDSYLSVSECVCEKAKLIRGDPHKIALKRRGSPLIFNNKLDYMFFSILVPILE